MGGVIQGIGGAVGGVTSSSGASNNPAHPLNGQVACLQAQVAHLTKLVHILWGEAQQVAEILHIDGQGLHISVGAANLKVLRTGVILLDAPTVKGSGGTTIGGAQAQTVAGGIRPIRP